MTEQIWNFVSSGAATLIVILGVMPLLKRFFSSYVDAKGRNLATKEDIGAITREVERVRHDYNGLLEQVKARNQLRMAAVDKRLQVHQEAFTNWRKLFMADADDLDAIAQEYRDWYNLNCIYLEPPVREAYLKVVSQEYMRRVNRVGGPSSAEVLSEHLGNMFAFPNLLFKAIELPPLSEVEKTALQSDDKTTGTDRSSIK
jgi:hypothetical protein